MFTVYSIMELYLHFDREGLVLGRIGSVVLVKNVVT